jgi:hypothetical protein
MSLQPYYYAPYQGTFSHNNNELERPLLPKEPELCTPPLMWLGVAVLLLLGLLVTLLLLWVKRPNEG